MTPAPALVAAGVLACLGPKARLEPPASLWFEGEGPSLRLTAAGREGASLGQPFQAGFVGLGGLRLEL